ncbi:MAG: hypothetical protein AB1467_00930 [Candidatus Diapherotrites archaeon]
MKRKEFFKRHEAKLIISVIALGIIVSFVLYLNQSKNEKIPDHILFAKDNEKYCDGMFVGCNRSFEKGCVNSIVQPKYQMINDDITCYCNMTKKVCETAKGFRNGDVEGKLCYDEKDCLVFYQYNKCVAENGSSTQGNCSNSAVPVEGCNYYMVEGKAQKICYSMSKTY